MISAKSKKQSSPVDENTVIFSLVAIAHPPLCIFLSLERRLIEARTHYLAYKPSLRGENNYVAKVIINIGEYCKTRLKLSTDISEVSQ